jgi:hypothetical protein
MPQIRTLFDSTRALSRPIEKVITYQNRSDDQLRAEISEYVVTQHIQDNFEDLLKKMQAAQQGGGGHEIGVWVSGFYGSGKSSFTKYLGFALDRGMKVGNDTFLQLLQNQLPAASTKALFNQVAGVYDAAVIFLDLASSMLAGASMEDVSTVLYLNVLQWAGYSEDLKVAELERMLERDGKLADFQKRAKEELDGIEWSEVHNQPLVANQIASRLAPEFYPTLFKTSSDFGDLTLHVQKAENKRVEEMLELIRSKSGKKNTIFIIDEVGQYVSAKQSLILNLDGLAKNLKDIGKGTAWIFATAQQTLTEDSPLAAINSTGLYKLKDRFPIQIHLEASDIKEICHRRLLTKSAAGENELGGLFEQSGASLRTAIRLTDAGHYEVELTKKVFIDLYPFLPAHFEILLTLLGRLAKKTGGLGLRSAIKVVQEVLIERGAGHAPLADGEVGELANTVTFYDALRRDILSTFPHVVEGVDRVIERIPQDALCHNVAKSIAILQILENLPVTAHNIAALIQPAVKASSLKEAVEAAVAKMLSDSMIPLGEKAGSLRFLTQAAVTLQKQFDQIEYRRADLLSEVNGVFRSIFKPLPSARIDQTRPVTAGLKVINQNGQQPNSLEGEKEQIQFILELVPSTSYEKIRQEREDDSRSTKERSNIYLLGRADNEIEQLGITLVRCRRFLESHRAAADQETQEYIRAVESRLDRTNQEIERLLSGALYKGSFIAHGAHIAVSSKGTDVLESAKSFLGEAAAKVFDRYSEAPVQVDTSIAEKFLKTPLDRITSDQDPLSLVTRAAGGRQQIKTTNKALISIVDYLGAQGQVEGRRLLDHFSAPPYGWSKDTTRYLLAAAFLAGEIKLRISGKDHQVKSDESLEAFSSNRAFGPVGISLREEKADNEALIRASDRLGDLIGDTVLPLEDEVATAAKKHLPNLQLAFSPLASELRNLDLSSSHAEKIENLSSDLAEILSGDGSDAVKRLGGTESPLFESLKWARGLKKSLDNGLREKLSHLTRIRREFTELPDTGLLAKLKESASEQIAAVGEVLQKEAFYEDTAQLGTLSRELDDLVSATVSELKAQQSVLAEQELVKWQSSTDWKDLRSDDQLWVNSEITKLTPEASGDLNGLKKLLNSDYALNHTLRELEKQVGVKAAEARKLRAEAAKKADPKSKQETKEETVLLPRVLESADQIESLVRQFASYLDQIRGGASIRLTCRLLEDGNASKKD